MHAKSVAKNKEKEREIDRQTRREDEEWTEFIGCQRTTNRLIYEETESRAWFLYWRDQVRKLLKSLFWIFFLSL